MAEYASEQDSRVDAVTDEATRYRSELVDQHLDTALFNDWRPLVVSDLWLHVWLGASPLMYKMRGMDALTDSLYDTWLVAGAPDMNGSRYGGVLARPLRDVIVIDSWQP